MSPFVNETYIDQKCILVLVRVIHKTFRRRQTVCRKLALCVMVVICLVAAKLMAILQGVVLLWLFVLLGVASVLFGIFLDHYDARIAIRAIEAGTDQRRTTFDENGITIDAPNGIRSFTPYSYVKAVFETDGYYVLQLDKRGTILDKAGFTQGDSESFRGFISERIGKDVIFIKIKR